LAAGFKVLVADDDPFSRRLLEATLTGWGYEVAVARSGPEAWDALVGPDAPALAFLDWVMPGFDGLEVCRRIRARAQDRYLYLVLVTANDRKSQVVEGLGAG